jgi:hypothetical protein
MLKHDASWDLKALAWMGVALFVVLLMVPAIWWVLTMKNVQLASDQLTSTSTGNGLIGELGSTCGGEQRLPCRPGLVCQADSEEAIGVCEKDPSQPAFAVSQFGESCGKGEAPCGPGLFCRKVKDGSGMSCDKVTADAPYIVSIKPQGMQPEEGWYRAKAGTKVQVLVQAVNAESAALAIFPKNEDGKEQDLGQMKKQEGGKFLAEFTVENGLEADLVATVSSASGEFSSLSINIATLP